MKAYLVLLPFSLPKIQPVPEALHRDGNIQVGEHRRLGLQRASGLDLVQPRRRGLSSGTHYLRHIRLEGGHEEAADQSAGVDEQDISVPEFGQCG